MGPRTASEDQQDGAKENHQSDPLPMGKPIPNFQNPLPEIWKNTPINIADSYFLQSLCVTLSNFDYPAAVFWGFELVLLYNKAWEDAGGILEQGRPQRGSLSPDAWHALQKCINGGRPSRISSHELLRERTKPERDEYMVLVSPLFEPNAENAKGVVCQMMYNQTNKRGKNAEKALQPEPEQAANKSGDAVTQPKMDGLASSLDYSTPLDEHPFFHRFAEMIPTGLAILDHNARAVFVNQHFYQLTTHWGEDQSFKSWPQSIHPEDYGRVMSAYQEAFRNQTELRAEFRALGSEHPWRLLLLTPLGDENLRHVSLGEYGGFICSVVDITSEKSAEEDQRLAAEEATERKQQQERFIDMISHEIRNPLSAMVHCVEDINEAIKTMENTGKIDAEPIAEALDTINLCISHQKNIVDDVLSYSKLDSSMLALTPKACLPEKELRGNTKMFQPEFRKHNIEFECRVDEPYNKLNVNWSMGDLSRIGQVLINLISNAIKFTSRKSGEKKITCKISASLDQPDSYPPDVVFFSRDQDVPRLDATQRKEWGSGEPLFIMVAVTDSGIGISEENQKKLFERFKQATPKTNEIYGGSGLGLNISRKLVQLHGGEIGVTSTEGKGATFGFFFRVRRSAPPEIEEQPEETKQKHESARGQIRLGGLDSKEETIGHEDQPEESRKPSNRLELQQSQTSSERQTQSNNLQHDLKKDAFEERQHTETHKQGEKQRTESEAKREAENQKDDGSDLAKTGESLDPTSTYDNCFSTNVTDKAPADHEGRGKGKEKQDTQKPSSEQQQQQQPFELPIRKRKETKQPLHVLLVEDNIINQKLVARKLASKKFIVSTAKDGRDAVDFVTETFSNPHSAGENDSTKQNGEIDIVLMDQEMPIMDGNAAAREIRERERVMGRGERLPILGVSANVRDEQLEEMTKSGMDEYITKPYKIEDMVAKIEGMIDE